jgi:hypothetical protein
MFGEVPMRVLFKPLLFTLWTFVAALSAVAEETTIRIDAAKAPRAVSRYLAGACIEDVNHEIYGGIYSQMIFGESFQEPPRSNPVKGFVAVDGGWSAQDGIVQGGDGPGPKLVSAADAFTKGEAGVEVYFPGNVAGNAGLIVKVDKAGPGADNFDGYEVSIDVARKIVNLGRHVHDWKLLREAPCDVAADRWIALSVKMTAETIEVFIDGKSVIAYEDRERPLRSGRIGLRDWQRTARYRKLWIDAGKGRTELPFESNPAESVRVSGMWQPLQRGSAVFAADFERDRPFLGTHSQRLTFASGTGEAGIENAGLNRQGLAFVAGKSYEGYLWARAAKPVEIFISLESKDGSRQFAEGRLSVAEDEWRRLDFALTPTADDAGRFAIRLKSPGSVVLGHVFLQPGDWGRFKGLPVRRDIAQGVIDQGLTVLRYGGSMVNAPEYRWKKMIGPRDRRPPYKGHWYPYSTNGWGIVDFLDLCEAAGFLGIPAFNIDESLQDMADFVEYVNGPRESNWGRKRAADGHAKPYALRHIELGNEERVDVAYYAKFKALAEAIWAKDPEMILIVGDFAYDRPIADPMKFEGANSGITSLTAHQKILELARARNREVWFDVHVWTDGPGPSPSLRALPTYIDALEKLSAGAKHKVVVFELNASNHRQRRALANAWALNAIVRDGRIPVVCSANSLQPDGQNDNGWDQGLLFLNPTKVWLQPPGYVTQMFARYFQPLAVPAEITSSDDKLSVTATRSVDGKTLTLFVVNLDDQPRLVQIALDGFIPTKPFAAVESLSAPIDAANTAENADQIRPIRSEWRHEMKAGRADYAFPPNSFVVVRFE